MLEKSTFLTKKLCLHYDIPTYNNNKKINNDLGVLHILYYMLLKFDFENIYQL